MVVQAIALLDDLDKEINIYAMRVKVCVSEGLLIYKRLTGDLGMVRLAFPRNGKNYLRQRGVRQSHPCHG